MNDKKWKIGEQIRYPHYKDEKLIGNKVQYGRSIASNYPRCNLNRVTIQKERSRKMDIINLFWENVEWHLDNKELWLSEHYQTARQERASITLAEVGEIAAALAIDDYAILFEEIE